MVGRWKRKKERLRAARVRPVEDLLTEAQDVLHEIELRKHALVRFNEDFATCTRGKPYLIWSPIALRLVHDQWLTCILELSSWTKQAVRPPGLLGQIERHPNASFVAGKPDGPWQSKPQRALVAAAHSQAFRFLFPRCHGDSPDEWDWMLLRWRLLAKCRELRRVRNALAHKHERPEPADFQVWRLESRFRFVRRVLRAMRLLLLDSTLHHPIIDESEQMAKELTDNILLGTAGFGMAREAAPRWWSRREGLYLELHAAHELLPEPKRVRTNFNEEAPMFIHQKWPRSAG